MNRDGKMEIHNHSIILGLDKPLEFSFAVDPSSMATKVVRGLESKPCEE